MFRGIVRKAKRNTVAVKFVDTILSRTPRITSILGYSFPAVVRREGGRGGWGEDEKREGRREGESEGYASSQKKNERRKNR